MNEQYHEHNKPLFTKMRFQPLNHIYEKFQKLNMDTSCIGLACGENTHYFCTPIGAKIIGWEGCDGIHYSFIDGFGEMVFVINPVTCCDHYVYPVADNFSDFLRLILAAKGTAALEQIIQWDKQDYIDFMNAPEQMQYASQKDVTVTLAAIESLGITPMEHPFSYVKSIQSRFNYRQIIFRDDFYEVTGISKFQNIT